MDSEVVIGTERYCIGKLKPDTGGWILQQLLNSLSEAAKGVDFSKIEATPDELKPSTEDSLNGMVRLLMSTASRAAYAEYQKITLSVVSQYKLVGEQEAKIPVLRLDGSFNSKELEYDIAGVTLLMRKVMVANLLPFFQDGGLNQ